MIITHHRGNNLIRRWSWPVYIIRGPSCRWTRFAKNGFAVIHVPSFPNEWTQWLIKLALGRRIVRWSEVSNQNIFSVHTWGDVSCMGRAFKWWKKPCQNEIRYSAANYDDTVIGTNNFLHANVICSQLNYPNTRNGHSHQSSLKVIMCSSPDRRPMPVLWMWTYSRTLTQFRQMNHTVECLLYGFLHFTVLSPTASLHVRKIYFNNVMVGFWYGWSFTVARYCRNLRCFHLFHIYQAAKHSSLLTHIVNEWKKKWIFF